MSPFKLTLAGFALAAGLGTTACSDDYGYGGYGYSRISVGYGVSDWDPYYGGYRGDPYWGWYGGYYYPGTGYYVYDRYNRRHRWSDSHRGYWEGRSRTWRDAHRDVRPVWRDYGVNRDDGRGDGRGDRRGRGRHRH